MLDTAQTAPAPPQPEAGAGETAPAAPPAGASPAAPPPEAPEPPLDVSKVVARVAARATEAFQRGQIIKSFEEFLADVYDRPTVHTRNAAQYLWDMVRFFGSRDLPGPGGPVRRWNVFDAPGTGGKGRVHGQERAQAEIVKYIRAFAEKGKVDKLLMLHGPNGSSKSSTVECLMRGLELYSLEPEGALYKFNWVFSDVFEKGGLGFAEARERARDVRESFAHADPEAVSARIPCEMRDNPLYLVPRDERRAILADAYRRRGLSPDRVPAHVLEGELSPKNREVYDTLLHSYAGDWRRLLQHVQVERFFISKRYRVGAVSIEPQRNVDAGSHALGFERGGAHVPAILHNSALVEATGDLVDANRGIVEYSDFFKRPLETNKYLLTTIEKNTISLPSYMGVVDLVFTSTSNEKQLCLFKRDPDFSSFKGRFELIKLPYLLEVSKEERIYADHLDAIGREKHVAPHTGRIAALWAVLTRLKRPRTKNYPGTLGNLIGRLTPVQKACLYDRGEAPAEFSDQERKELLANLERIRTEFDDQEEEFEGLLDAAYEGRRGASPREMQSLLSDSASYAEFPCLSPLAVLKALRQLVRDVSVYDFLRLTPQSGYNDNPKLIDDVEGEFRRMVEADVMDAMDLVSEREYQRHFDDYFAHVKAFVRGEKVESRLTGESAPPDEELMGAVEKTIDVKEKPEVFRRNLVTRIAAYTIEHPGRKIDMRALFGDVFQALKADVFKKREKQIETLLRDILKLGTDDMGALATAQQRLVLRSVARLKARHGYCLHCAKEAVAYVLKHRLR
jgi:predicted Ser/Thr protein kinase